MRELPCAYSRGNSAMLWSPDLHPALPVTVSPPVTFLISYPYPVYDLTRAIAEFLTAHKSYLPQGSYNLWTLAARLFLEIVSLIRHAKRWQRVFRSYCVQCPLCATSRRSGA